MKVQFKLGYYGYIVDREDAVHLLDIFSRATDSSGDFVPCSIEKAPNFDLEALKKEIKEDFNKEIEQYKGYWLSGNTENEKLKKELKELKEKQG